MPAGFIRSSCADSSRDWHFLLRIQVDFPTSGGNNVHGFNCTADTVSSLGYLCNPGSRSTIAMHVCIFLREQITVVEEVSADGVKLACLDNTDDL